MNTLQRVLCAIALLGGIAALLLWGVPLWLVGLQLILMMGVALSYGFSNRLPGIPWLRLRPIRGTVLVVLGIVAMYIQPQLLVAACLIGCGVRLVWASACENERAANDQKQPCESRGIRSYSTEIMPARVESAIDRLKE